MKLTLYGTSACHLCELAAAMLSSSGAAFREVDISDSDTLFERYGLVIPVLRKEHGSELHWPFNEDTLQAFLDEG